MQRLPANEKIHIPSELPAAHAPTANGSFVVKYVDRIATLGTNSAPAPSPMQMACASTTCQYSWQMLVIIWPKTIRNEPAMSKMRKWPAS